MNYFLTRRHYIRVAVVPPPLFCGKTWRTRVSLTGLFLFFLPPRRSECFSRRVKLALATPNISPSPAFFSFCLRSTSRLHRGKREEAYATPSLWLFSPLLSSPRDDVSFPPMPRWNRNRRSPLSLSCVAFSLFTLLSCSRPRFPLFPSRYGSPQTLD